MFTSGNISGTNTDLKVEKISPNAQKMCKNNNQKFLES